MKRISIELYWRGVRPSLLLSRVIRKVAKSCAKLYGRSVTVTVTVTDNETIRAMNSEYRQIDSETDVLSFPAMEFASPLHPLAEEFDPEKKAAALGDIVISLDKAKEQAEEYATGLRREIGFLCAHGMLHLLGYDHEQSREEEERMFALQENILSSLGYTRKSGKKKNTTNGKE